jgi:hypothetical protein
MLCKTAGWASEILALNVENLDLDNWRAPFRSKGSVIEWVHLGAASQRQVARGFELAEDILAETRGISGAVAGRARIRSGIGAGMWQGAGRQGE